MIFRKSETERKREYVTVKTSIDSDIAIQNAEIESILYEVDDGFQYLSDRLNGAGYESSVSFFGEILGEVIVNSMIDTAKPLAEK